MPLPAGARASFQRRQAFTEQEEAWKRFGYHSEAGRLLRQLYGGGKERFRVKYPKVKKDTTLVDPKNAGVWTTGRPDQVDPRSRSDRREREKRFQVPRLKLKSEGSNKKAAIDFVPRRKSKSRIEEDLGEIEREAMHFRPKARPAISTETEKRRLALCNQFMGGKALPHNATLDASLKNIPLHLVTGKLTKAAMKSIEAAKQARADRRKEEEAREKKDLERQFEEASEQVSVVQRRIEACQGKPNCMRSIGRLRQELSERIAEMQRIDEILATFNVDKA